jgi:predicted enzyme related to lactoylglutathione lyase
VRPTAPPEEGGFMASPVVHFQVCAEDVGAMSAFYRDVFGWRIAPRRLTSVEADVSSAYPYVEADEGGIPGGISNRVPRKGGCVFVVEVADIAATLERVERLGGHRRFAGTPPEAMEMSGSDEVGVPFKLQEFEDPEGNLVGIIER